jgi:ESS family glutamate:Na+ symporter
MPLMNLDFVGTLAAAGLVLFAGHGLQRRVPLLLRYNVPAPVIGGLLVAVGVTLLRMAGRPLLAFDTTLQAPLMIAFFTSIGFGASLPLLRSGGRPALVMLALATLLAVLQNLVGGGVAALLGAPRLLGVIAGSLTLAGGPATALAFAPDFEQAGVAGAATLAIASAMVGIVSAGLLGGPIGTLLIERRRLSAGADPAVGPDRRGTAAGGAPLAEGHAPAAPAILKSIVVLAATMAVGSWIGAGMKALGATLPAYIGAMLAAAVLRNLDDATGWVALPRRLLQDLGQAALSLFIAMALMTLKLWELAGLALPLAAILAVQVGVGALLCLWPTFRLMGRDYEAAVMSSGFCGFMLGTTANAMANMEALTERYGPAPRAYLVVPMVGAFFIDFTNALVITAFLGAWR